MPSWIRIVQADFLCNVDGIWAKILFIDNPVITDNKSFDTSYTVLGGYCKQRESSDHRPVNDIIQAPKTSCWPLSLKYFEIIAMIARARVSRVSFLNGHGHSFRNRPPRTVIWLLPIQAVVLPGRADDPLGVLMNSGIVMNLSSVFFLC